MKNYYIAMRKYYYGRNTHWQLLRSSDDDSIIIGTYRQVRKTIDGLNDSVYHLATSEYSRPDYKIVGIDSVLGQTLRSREF